MLPVLLYQGEHFGSNFFYYSGLSIDHAFYLSKPRTLLVPRLNYVLAKKLFGRKGRVIAYSDVSKALKPLISKRKIAIDGRSLPVSVYKKLNRFAKLQDFSEEFLKKRAVKKKNEIEKISRAVKITKKILKEFEYELKKPKSESKIKTEGDGRNFLLGRALAYGVEAAFDPIVATGENTKYPHYQSGNNARLRDLVQVDFGVRYKNYCGDVSRVFFIKRNAEYERNYGKLQNIFFELINFLPKFKTGKDFAVFAEKRYKKHGLPHPPHSIGHGIGLDVHEFPRLSKKYNDGISGSTIAIEPSVYFKDYGLRFEETVYFTGKKSRIF